MSTKSPTSIWTFGHPNHVLQILESRAVTPGSNHVFAVVTRCRHPPVVEAVVAGYAAGAHASGQEQVRVAGISGTVGKASGHVQEIGFGGGS